MTPPLADKHILIVEDDPVFRAMLGGYLASLGAKTGEAEDGEQALVLRQKASPRVDDLRSYDAEYGRYRLARSFTS